MITYAEAIATGFYDFLQSVLSGLKEGKNRDLRFPLVTSGNIFGSPEEKRELSWDFYREHVFDFDLLHEDWTKCKSGRRGRKQLATLKRCNQLLRNDPAIAMPGDAAEALREVLLQEYGSIIPDPPKPKRSAPEKR